MDFSEKCDIEREDEIGNLAKTLNFLSKNLSNALDDLKIKNKKLKNFSKNCLESISLGIIIITEDKIF